MRRDEALAGAVVGVVLALHCQTEPVMLKQLPVTQQTAMVEQMQPIEAVPLVAYHEVPAESKPESWYGTDRKLTDAEWEAMSQMIMAEARGESFEVQYYIACVVLNRVDSPLFPNTVAGVIYQTQPAVQFYGAWDTEQYEPSDSVLEAIQTALENNHIPEDVFYFTSEGFLPGTEPWERVGNMWFSRQEE